MTAATASAGSGSTHGGSGDGAAIIFRWSSGCSIRTFSFVACSRVPESLWETCMVIMVEAPAPERVVVAAALAVVVGVCHGCYVGLCAGALLFRGSLASQRSCTSIQNSCFYYVPQRCFRSRHGVTMRAASWVRSTPCCQPTPWRCWCCSSSTPSTTV